MYAECVKNSAPTPPSPPRCVRCARPMQLVRKTRRFGELPDLYTFQCRACDESHIEECDVAGRTRRKYLPLSRLTNIGRQVTGSSASRLEASNGSMANAIGTLPGESRGVTWKTNGTFFRGRGGPRGSAPGVTRQ